MHERNRRGSTRPARSCTGRERPKRPRARRTRGAAAQGAAGPPVRPAPPASPPPCSFGPSTRRSSRSPAYPWHRRARRGVAASEAAHSRRPRSHSARGSTLAPAQASHARVGGSEAASSRTSPHPPPCTTLPSVQLMHGVRDAPHPAASGAGRSPRSDADGCGGREAAHASSRALSLLSREDCRSEGSSA